MALTPKKSEDWKKRRRNLQAVTGDLPEIVYWDDTGRTLLEEGTRKTLSNRDEEAHDRGRLLGMMEERLRRRKINRKAPKKITITPYEKRLKGLFGSDDD